MPRLVQCGHASILGEAVGDALGVPVEGDSRASLRTSPVVSMQPSRRGIFSLPAGTWSDDTSMTLALLDSLTRKGFDPEDQARNYLRWLEKGIFTADGRVFSYGSTTFNALSRIASGIPIAEAADREERHNGNGSLMRTHPLIFFGNFDNLEKLFDFSCRASAVTHAHPISQLACAIETIVGRFLVSGLFLSEALASTKTTIREILPRYPSHQSAFPHFSRLFDPNFGHLDEDNIQSGFYVVHTLEAALWCLFNTTSFRDAVTRAVNLGGDTDTTANVTGALGGIIYGMGGIPREWLEVLARRKDIERMINIFGAVEWLG